MSLKDRNFKTRLYTESTLFVCSTQKRPYHKSVFNLRQNETVMQSYFCFNIIKIPATVENKAVGIKGAAVITYIILRRLC